MYGREPGSEAPSETSVCLSGEATVQKTVAGTTFTAMEYDFTIIDSNKFYLDINLATLSDVVLATTCTSVNLASLGGGLLCLSCCATIAKM